MYKPLIRFSDKTSRGKIVSPASTFTDCGGIQFTRVSHIVAYPHDEQDYAPIVTRGSSMNVDEKSVAIQGDKTGGDVMLTASQYNTTD
jgi:uncharacterized Zn-binding protein involved in type VI secretion